MLKNINKNIEIINKTIIALKALNYFFYRDGDCYFTSYIKNISSIFY